MLSRQSKSIDMTGPTTRPPLHASMEIKTEKSFLSSPFPTVVRHSFAPVPVLAKAFQNELPVTEDKKRWVCLQALFKKGNEVRKLHFMEQTLFDLKISRSEYCTYKTKDIKQKYKMLMILITLKLRRTTKIILPAAWQSEEGLLRNRRCTNRVRDTP